ncbi:ribonuclease III domain-containing protein [Myxozyma melibiosi]|uniref:Ribonuclease III domain-containing protein n=1 Tax=Myxozyma melibiosi TaxID=54550 RepID=A0ABR1F4M5_9ASCO
MQALGTVDARVDFINKLRRFSSSSSSSSPAWPPPLPPLTTPEIESRVFTHRSASKDKSKTYDRLEYLGDSFIHYAITRITYLFFPSADEGALSELRNELVSNSRLASYAELYALDSRLVTAASAARPTSQMAKVRADLFEAYIGGILHDDPIDGAEIAESFLRDLFAPALLTIERANIRAGKIDNKAKDKLYDLVGGKYQAIAYLDIPSSSSSSSAASGANGDARTATSGFAVKCVVGNEEIGSGWAMNRADAQARAAMSALRSPSVVGKYRRQKVANLSRHDREAKLIAERQ